MELELRLRESGEKMWTAIKFTLWHKFLIQREYKHCLQEARNEANKLEISGMKPEEISREIQNYLRENCPDLNVLVEGNDVYIEVKSFETRIYFDWRARIKAG